jgi:hypothetical protein
MTNGKTFNDFVESVRVEDASYANLFDGGTNISQRLRQRFEADTEYRQHLAETMQFIREYRAGHVAPARFREAMTTSDFPILLGGVIDRTLLGGYREYPASFEMWCKINRNITDFRTISRGFLNLADGALDTVAQQEEYQAAGAGEGQYTYAVQKYGRKFKFSWESFVNDNLGAFSEVPMALGRAARRTTARFATSLICGAAGPNPVFFSAANGNMMNGGNSALSQASLAAAANLLAQQMDNGGEPIFNDPAVLVVPPSLKLTAMQIVNALQIRAQSAGGADVGGTVQLDTVNLFQNLKIAVEPYISRIITAGTVGRTSWFLAADPAQSERPAVEIGFLQGHEEPQIAMKSPNAVMVGGGDVNAFAGDFDTDSIEFRVRHIVGGTLMDPRMMVGSFGQ